MNMLNSQTWIKDYIELYLKEILTNVDSESGHINIHINPYHKTSKLNLDYPRQAFIYFTLSYLSYYIKLSDLASHFSKYNLQDKLQKLSTFMKVNHEEETDNLKKKYIELYCLRASVFMNDSLSINFWVESFKKENLNLIYTQPLLLGLYLNTVHDLKLFKYDNTLDKGYIDLLTYHLPTAVEAYYSYFKIKSETFVETYHYMDFYYFKGVDWFNDKYYLAGDTFIKEKLSSDNINELYSSAIAKVFEGLCNNSSNCLKDNLGYLDIAKVNITNSIEKYFKIVLDRTVKLDQELIRNYKYTENSISEIESTSYVCLDTYAHLLLGLVRLISKEVDYR